jgi:hypothetical protein
MTGSNRSLQRVWAESTAKILGSSKGCQTTMDEQLIPEPSVLVE